jgi:hypothetical protein
MFAISVGGAFFDFKISNFSLVFKHPIESLRGKIGSYELQNQLDCI